MRENKTIDKLYITSIYRCTRAYPIS